MRKEVRKILKINRKLVSRGDQDLVYRPLKAVYQAGYLPGGQGTIITELYKYTPYLYEDEWWPDYTLKCRLDEEEIQALVSAGITWERREETGVRS